MSRFWARAMALLLSISCCAALCFPCEVKAADYGPELPPEVEVESYVLIDASTGQVLAEKNAYMAEYPASITKILTIGLILEGMADVPEKRMDAAQTSYRACHELIYGATHIALSEGEVMSVNDLLYATQIESANDAANVLAEYESGSIEGFAGRMNDLAAGLGLSGSHFSNPSGQPAEDHYTTAYDMAQITRWALAVPGFREIFGSTEHVIAPTNNRAAEFTCRNNNSIMNPSSEYYYPGITGSKMGYTNDARYTLVTTATRNDMELICVVMNCATNESKYLSTIQLLDYGFGNFSPAVYPGSALGEYTVPVYGGGSEELGEITLQGADVPYLLHNSLSADAVTAECIIPESYVIGQPFEPVVQLTLPDGTGMQPAQLASAPMSWTGLDEIFAANTSAWDRAMEKTPPFVKAVVGVLLVLVLLVAGRIAYVRHRRYKRRMARIAQARAKLPIRLEPRPEVKSRTPAPRQSSISRARQFGLKTTRPEPVRSSQPYMYGTAAAQPRRVGRAR